MLQVRTIIQTIHTVHLAEHNQVDCKTPAMRTCLANPCFQGVRCYDDPKIGFRCGPCPAGFRGDGVQCRPMSICTSNPCWANVTCVEYDQPPGYRCGACPHGFIGNGITCTDINECEYAQPCDVRTSCVNLSPGFQCSPCPVGYHGRSVYGVGVEEARSLRQVIYFPFCFTIREKINFIIGVH